MSFRVLSAFISLLSVTGLSAASDAAANGATGNSVVVATVNGTSITLAEFESKRPLALFQARNSYFEAEKKAIDAYMDDYLLELQAKKENLTVEKLLELHVNSHIAKDPSDEALKVYYEGLDTQEAFEAVRDKIRDHLRDRRIAKAKTVYMASLRSAAKISVQVEAPRASVAIGTSPVRGPGAAPVTLIEFADYECPYCQQIAPDLLKVEAEFKGKIAFVYKDMPLPMHSRAQKASEAAHCAGAQNKYWEFHDQLVAGKQLDLPQLKDVAKVLGLNTTAFNSCLDSGEKAQTVKNNMDEAMQLGLTGTPSFFLNGRFISGSLSYDQLRQQVDDELKAATASGQRTAER